MDRTAWVAVSLCVIALVAWEWWILSNRPPSPVPVTAPATATSAGSVSPTATPLPQIASAPPTASSPAAVPTAPPQAENPAFEEKIDSLRNEDAELRLTNRGGAIKEILLLRHLADRGERVVLNAGNSTPIGAIAEDPASPSLAEFVVVKNADQSMQMERATPEGVKITKRFFFTRQAAKDNYILGMDIDFRNDGAQPHRRSDYFITLGSAQPVHEGDWPTYTRIAWSIDGQTKLKDVTWFDGAGGFLGMGAHGPQQTFQEGVGNPQWVAVSNQFFTTLFTPLGDKPNQVWAQRFGVTREGQKPGKPLYGINGAMRMPGFEVAPGQTKTLNFQLYAGPKIYNRLSKLEHDEAGVVDFGVFLGLGFIKFVSQFLLNLLNWIHGFVRDYGFSILILTAIVKGVLWPLQNKANRSMRKMALLSPKMQEYRTKYKDDPTKMNQEVMKLYKDYGVNPVSGCAPMMIQIPIFFGLFSMLGQAVELRDATFLWVDDLSQPDTVGYLPLLGWPINILPLMMAVTNVWLMQMTPKTGDPTQRRVMMFMPLIFVIFCYNFAAALSLYYTAQNLLTILQLWQNQRQPAPVLEKVAVAQKKARKQR